MTITPHEWAGIGTVVGTAVAEAVTAVLPHTAHGVPPVNLDALGEALGAAPDATGDELVRIATAVRSQRDALQDQLVEATQGADRRHAQATAAVVEAQAATGEARAELVRLHEVIAEAIGVPPERWDQVDVPGSLLALAADARRWREQMAPVFDPVDEQDATARRDLVAPVLHHDDPWGPDAPGLPEDSGVRA